MDLVSRPCGKEELTSVGTAAENGVVAIPDGSTTPFYPATQVSVFVADKAYVCLGSGDTPEATPPAEQCAVQQADTERTYTLTGIADPAFDHVWVYAAASTTSADISFFG